MKKKFGSQAAIRYAVRVEIHESLRLKHGVLFDASGHVVHLAYSTTPGLFATGLPIFENALATLTVPSSGPTTR